MDITKKLVGTAIAGAVAVAFVSSTFAADNSIQTTSSRWVKCYGINACRAQSSCRLTTNTCKIINNCKGQNACKGQGWKFKSPAECKRLGGSAPEMPSAMNEGESSNT